MKNNNAGSKKPFNKGNNPNRKTKEEYEAMKAEQIARQSKNLDVIEAMCAYLNDWLKGEKTSNRINMKDILGHLNGEKGFTADETKAVSQYSYMLLELFQSCDNPRTLKHYKAVFFSMLQKK